DLSDRLLISPRCVIQTLVRFEQLIWIFPVWLLLIAVRKEFQEYWSTPRIRMFLILFMFNLAIYFFYPASSGGPGPRYLIAYFPFLVLAIVDLYHFSRQKQQKRTQPWWALGLAALIIGNLSFLAAEVKDIYKRRD